MSAARARKTRDRIVPMGTPMRVRARHAPDSTPWTEATVCWSLEATGRSEIGCRFNETPPWSVLLLFG